MSLTPKTCCLRFWATARWIAVRAFTWKNSDLDTRRLAATNIYHKIFRAVAFLWLLSNFIHQIVRDNNRDPDDPADAPFRSYLTMWGLTTSTFSFLFLNLVPLAEIGYETHPKLSTKPRPWTFIGRFVQLLTTWAFSTEFLIPTAFWAFMIINNTFTDTFPTTVMQYLTTFVHGVVTILWIIEMAFGNIILLKRHFVYMFLGAIAYITVFHKYLAQNVEENNDAYIYEGVELNIGKTEFSILLVVLSVFIPTLEVIIAALLRLCDRFRPNRGLYRDGINRPSTSGRENTSTRKNGKAAFSSTNSDSDDADEWSSESDSESSDSSSDDSDDPGSSSGQPATGSMLRFM